jgi:hypothetical protein
MECKQKVVNTWLRSNKTLLTKIGCGEGDAQTMHTHVSKCKNDKRNLKKKKEELKK